MLRSVILAVKKRVRSGCPAAILARFLEELSASLLLSFAVTFDSEKFRLEVLR